MKTNSILNNETSQLSTRRPVGVHRVKQIFAAAVLAGLALAATGTAHALPIENGGFERGDLTGWNWSLVGFDGGVTTDEAYAGSYSLELDACDFVWQEVDTLKRFSTLSFAVKASHPTLTWGTKQAIVKYHDGTSSTLDIYSTGVLASGDWAILELPLDNTKRIVEVRFEVFDSYPIYIDNVSLHY